MESFVCILQKGFRQQVGILIALGQVVSTPFAIPDMVYQLVDNVNYYAMEGNGISNDEEGSDGLDDEHNLFKNNVKPVSGDAFESISSWRADSTKLGENKYIESQHIPMAVYLVNSTFTVRFRFRCAFLLFLNCTQFLCFSCFCLSHHSHATSC